MAVDEGHHAGDVVEARDRGDRRGQKITGGNQHAAQAAPHGTEGFGGDGDDAAAFGVAPTDLDILQGEWDEAQSR